MGTDGLASVPQIETKMNNSDAVSILKDLADSLTVQDPTDLAPGEAGRCIRLKAALLLGVGALLKINTDKAVNLKKRMSKMPSCAGMPWSNEEDEMLRREFEDNSYIPDLAETHKRTCGAISARLQKLGLIEPLQITGSIAVNR